MSKIAKYKIKDCGRIYTIGLSVGYCFTDIVAEEIWFHYSSLHNSPWLNMAKISDEQIKEAIKLYFLGEI